MRGKGPARDLKKEREWREQMRRWKRSGESVRAFCRREGLHESAFFAWRRELTRRRQERQAVRAKGKEAEPSVPVQVTAGGPVDDLGGVEILLKAGHVLRVRPGFDRQTLAEVLAALEASPC